MSTRARPSRFWLVTVVALVAVVVAASLGRWQLSRAAQKEALQARIDAQGREPPLDQQAFVGTASAVGDALHRTVHLRGLWLGSQTVYLDNRQMRGVPGFYVLTPLALEGSDQTVMVQRGWIQRNFESRTRLQPVQTPAGLIEIDARVATPPSHLFELGKPKPVPQGAEGEGNSPTEGSSLIRQNLDLEAFRAETGLPLRTDVSLQQTGEPSEGLQRDWPAPALGVERHYGYAFQWFGLAVLVAFLYVWFQFIAPRRKAHRGSVAGHG